MIFAPSAPAGYRLLEDSEESRERQQQDNWRRRRRHQSPSNNDVPTNSYTHRLSFRLWVTSLVLLLCFLLFLLLTRSTIFAFPRFSLKMTRPEEPYRVLRVMTFNIWLSGERVKNGLEKIAKQIKIVDPDIVTLQELQTAEVGKNLTNLLGASKWRLVHHPYAKYPDTAIVTKHKFVSELIELQFKRNISDFLFHEEHYLTNSIVTYGVGVSIELTNGQRVNVFSMHLDWKSYGPYAANNKLVTDEKQIMAGEHNKEGYGRAQNIEQLISNDAFKNFMELSDTQPFIVAGDFNCPSHLDWTKDTKAIHGGWEFKWPATKLLMDTGFLDSYRQVHPDVLETPGVTWSTVQKSIGPEWDWMVPEPQDRIDFIFYKPNSVFRPIHSSTYAGNGTLKPIPEQWENEWPSDHFSVVTDFAFDLLDNNGSQNMVDKTNAEQLDNHEEMVDDPM